MEVALFSPPAGADGYACLFSLRGRVCLFVCFVAEMPYRLWLSLGHSTQRLLSPLFFPCPPPLSLCGSLAPHPPPPSSNPWKFGTNELTAELPPRSLVPNYTVLHTRFILQMARLRSPAGRGHLFHWSVKVDGCCFRILCDQLRAPSNHPAPYVENKSPCYWAHSSCDGCLYVCVCVPLLLLLRCSVTGIGTSVIWCTHLRVVVADAWNHDGYPCSFFFLLSLPLVLTVSTLLPLSPYSAELVQNILLSNRFAGSAQSDGDVFASQNSEAKLILMLKIQISSFLWSCFK